MRILLAQNALYVPAHGGAAKAARATIEALAVRHECRAVVRAVSAQGVPTVAALAQALSSRRISFRESPDGAVVFTHGGVEVHAVVDPRRLSAYVVGQIAAFDPAWTLVASEDPGQVLLEACLPRAVLFAQTPFLLPLGPHAMVSFARGRELIRRAAGVITISAYLQDYLRRWAGVESAVLWPPVFGDGRHPAFGTCGKGDVTLVNACGMKGLPIFEQLARHYPAVSFAAVLGWGTTRDDERMLRAMPNVTLFDSVDDIDTILAQTQVLLMPSLCVEGLGYTAIDAMLRGIPVLASDAGGLREAKLGVDYTLPVSPIVQYERRLDDRNNLVPVIPAQDGAPWIDALGALLGDRQRYERVAAESQAAARAAIDKTGIAAFERYFEQLDVKADVAVSRSDPPPRASFDARARLDGHTG